MIYLNVGFNWDLDLAKKLIKLNETYSKNTNVIIDSVYGSTIDNPFGSARPVKRLSNVQTWWVRFKNCCLLLKNHGIKVNYTINSYCIGEEGKIKFEPAIDWLFSLSTYVQKVTIANPIILYHILDDIPEKTFEIILSTILNIDTQSHYLYYNNLSPDIKGICLALSRNRDISFLQKVSKFKIYTELLANEFCNINGCSCQGIYRQCCYQNHSHNVFGGYNRFLMDICSTSRWNNPSSWLKARFILPQWMELYEKIGINYLKITGRTHDSNYIYETTKSYMTRTFDKNLPLLWGLLENIYNKLPVRIPFTIDFNFEEKLKFINHWFDNPDFRCSEQLCGYSTGCMYCDIYYNHYFKINKGEPK